jgi:hypothetical protein
MIAAVRLPDDEPAATLADDVARATGRGGQDAIDLSGWGLEVIGASVPDRREGDG